MNARIRLSLPFISPVDTVPCGTEIESFVVKELSAESLERLLASTATSTAVAAAATAAVAAATTITIDAVASAALVASVK